MAAAREASACFKTSCLSTGFAFGFCFLRSSGTHHSSSAFHNLPGRPDVYCLQPSELLLSWVTFCKVAAKALRLTPSIVFAAIRAARQGSAIRQFTIAVVERTTLSAVVVWKGPSHEFRVGLWQQPSMRKQVTWRFRPAAPLVKCD
eukprot:1055184-Amphidinium_carterae.1